MALFSIAKCAVHRKHRRTLVQPAAFWSSKASLLETLNTGGRRPTLSVLCGILRPMANHLNFELAFPIIHSLGFISKLALDVVNIKLHRLTPPIFLGPRNKHIHCAWFSTVQKEERKYIIIRRRTGQQQRSGRYSSSSGGRSCKLRGWRGIRGTGRGCGRVEGLAEHVDS